MPHPPLTAPYPTHPAAHLCHVPWTGVAGKRCRVVDSASRPAQQARAKLLAAGSPICPVDSFGNAEAASTACGWAVVRGYAVYQLLLSDDAGERQTPAAVLAEGGGAMEGAPPNPSCVSEARWHELGRRERPDATDSRASASAGWLPRRHRTEEDQVGAGGEDVGAVGDKVEEEDGADAKVVSDVRREVGQLLRKQTAQLLGRDATPSQHSSGPAADPAAADAALPARAASGGAALVQQLQQLQQLHSMGALTATEFSEAKARVLSLASAQDDGSAADAR